MTSSLALKKKLRGGQEGGGELPYKFDALLVVPFMGVKKCGFGTSWGIQFQEEGY